jgi:hypothetical protein
MITLSQDDLIDVIDQVTVALGEILVSHAELTEGLLDKTATDQFQNKIDDLKEKTKLEKEKLKKVKTAQDRRRYLEKVNKANAKRPQNEVQSLPRVICLKNSRGQVVGWIRRVGANRTVVMNQNGALVAIEANGKTYNNRGEYFGTGSQGVRLLTK